MRVHPAACRQNITFDEATPLELPAGFNLSITCVDQRSAVNILAAGVPGDAALTLRRCRFATVATLDAAESDLALGAFGAAFLGLDGSLFLEECHVLFTATVRTSPSHGHTAHVYGTADTGAPVLSFPVSYITPSAHSALRTTRT